MNRFVLFTCSFFLILFIPSIYASADCFVDGMIPGQGNIVVCDNNAPNPDPNGVQVGVESTNNNDEITVETGASINNAAGRAINAGLGADLIMVNPGAGNITGSGANLSLSTAGSNNTMVVHGGNLTNGIFFDIGDNNSVEFGDATINSGNNGIFFNNGSGNSATIHSGIINGSNNGIFFNEGDNNSVEFHNATITAGNNGIFFNSGANRSLVFHSGTINSGNNAIFFNNGDSTVHINGGTLIPFGVAIITRDGEDSIVLRGGNINPGNTGLTILTGAANDTVRIERVSSFSGLIDGEEGDGDTLVFAQRIPSNDECNMLREQIASLNPADDSITINGILFTWINFEIIEDQLRCPDPIPTMTEWGFIVLVVALGIFGLLAIRKRKVTA